MRARRLNKGSSSSLSSVAPDFITKLTRRPLLLGFVVTLLIFIFSVLYLFDDLWRHHPSQFGFDDSPLKAQQSFEESGTNKDNSAAIDSVADVDVDNGIANIANRNNYPQSLANIDSNPQLLQSDNFYHLISRKWFGFTQTEYSNMKRILSLYAEFHSKTVETDAASNGALTGRYIIVKPAAQMCNRLRAHMGAIFLGIVTKRVVFLDMSAEGYAARLGGVFKNPGFIWEFSEVPQSLRQRLGNGKNLNFPYEVAGGNVHKEMTCHNWLADTERVWQLSSHAAFLPVIARNPTLRQAVASQSDANDFSSLLIANFPVQSQEQFETLEVLLARILYQLETDLQQRVDTLITQSYAKAEQFYAKNGISIPPGEKPIVMGIHMRSEYLLSMNLPKSKDKARKPLQNDQGGIEKMGDEYQWFTDCGNLIIDPHYVDKPFFVFFAGDTPKSQKFAESTFGADRVLYQPFIRTGKTLDGIKDAVVDLVTMASFDGFIATPHSSYSEMGSLLGQPRRIMNSDGSQLFLPTLASDNDWMRMAVNRPIIPMMTHTKWEIQKFNKYVFGRAIDINLKDGRSGQRRFPLTLAKRDNIAYDNDNICKLHVSASMGWMGMFDMFKRVDCYTPSMHHPGPWFPLADK